MKYEYPINVLCFNRPDYLELLLDSLKKQTVEIHPNQIHFWVDGYRNSKDEYMSRENRTRDTISVIKHYFPNSHLEVEEANIGIALNYWKAELNSFEKLKADSAYFLEEDMVLSPRYFEMAMKMDLFFSEDPDVSHISPTGDVSHTASNLNSYFQASGHFWGYLLRSWHHFERREFIATYLDFVKSQPYFLRGKVEFEILEYFFNRGIPIAGTSQDTIKCALRNYFGRISVTTTDRWATNVGIVGENFIGETPYHNRKITTELGSFPTIFSSQMKEVLKLDSRKKTLTQVYSNYIEKRDALLSERDALLSERDALLSERDALLRVRAALEREGSGVVGV